MHSQFIVVVTCPRVPAISRVARIQNVVTISTSIYCRTTIIPAPYSLFSAAQILEQRGIGIIHPDPAPNESRRVGQEGQLKQWCVVRSEALLWQKLHVDTPTSPRERAVMPKGSGERGGLRRPSRLRGRVFEIYRMNSWRHAHSSIIPKGGFGERRVKLYRSLP